MMLLSVVCVQAGGKDSGPRSYRETWNKWGGWGNWRAWLLLGAFICAMFALFGNFGGDLGENLWKDQGASMWLRLGVMIPCLTLVLGASFVAGRRMYHRTIKTEDEYNTWKGADNKILGSNAYEKSQMFFCVGLWILAIVISIAGHANWDDHMFRATVIPMFLIAGAGFWYFWRYKKVLGFVQVQNQNSDVDNASGTSPQPELELKSVTSNP